MAAPRIPNTDLPARQVSMRCPPAEAVSIELEAAFADIDALQIAWHGHYFRYLDLARTALMRSRELDIPQLMELNYRMVVVESHCRHIFPLHYGDKFRVTAWVVEAWNRIKIAYLIFNLTHDRRTARAHTVLVTTDPAGRCLWETPPEIRKRLHF